MEIRYNLYYLFSDKDVDELYKAKTDKWKARKEAFILMNRRKNLERKLKLAEAKRREKYYKEKIKNRIKDKEAKDEETEED